MYSSKKVLPWDNFTLIYPTDYQWRLFANTTSSEEIDEDREELLDNLFEHVSKAISKLKPQLKETLEAYYFTDLTQEEIGYVLDVDQSRVYQRICGTDAKQKLKNGETATYRVRGAIEYIREDIANNTEALDILRQLTITPPAKKQKKEKDKRKSLR